MNRSSGYERLACGLTLAVTMLLGGCESGVGGKPQVRPGQAASTPRAMEFTATAYSVKGQTANGAHTHDGVVAADPDVLPFGTRVHISDAGDYSGNYVVTDTGRKIEGRHIDIFIPNAAKAKRFGKRTVRVEVLSHPSHQYRGG